MQKIVVPFDFSEAAKEALSFAHDMVEKRFAQRIELIYYLNTPIPKEFDFHTETTDNTILTIRQKAQDLKDRLESITIADELYLPPKVIIQELYREVRSNHDLSAVVIGQMLQQHEGFERIIQKPVIYPRGVKSLNHVRNILISVESEGLSEEFLIALESFVNLVDANLFALAHNANEQSINQLTAQKSLAKRLTIHAFPGCDKSYEILKYAKIQKMDFIALAHPQLSEIKFYMESSVADQIIQNSTTSIWSMSKSD